MEYVREIPIRSSIFSKWAFFLLVFFSLSVTAYSQDKIAMTYGDTIECKILGMQNFQTTYLFNGELGKADNELINGIFFEGKWQTVDKASNDYFNDRIKYAAINPDTVSIMLHKPELSPMQVNMLTDIQLVLKKGQNKALLGVAVLLGGVIVGSLLIEDLPQPAVFTVGAGLVLGTVFILNGVSKVSVARRNLKDFVAP